MKKDNSSLIELATETADLLFRDNRGELSKPAKTLMEISKKFGFNEAKKLDLNQYRKMRTDGSGDNLGTIINMIKELSKNGKLSDKDIPGFLGYLSRELKYLESPEANTITDVPVNGKDPKNPVRPRPAQKENSGPATQKPFAELEELKRKLQK